MVSSHPVSASVVWCGLVCSGTVWPAAVWSGVYGVVYFGSSVVVWCGCTVACGVEVQRAVRSPILQLVIKLASQAGCQDCGARIQGEQPGAY